MTLPTIGSLAYRPALWARVTVSDSQSLPDAISCAAKEHDQ